MNPLYVALPLFVIIVWIIAVVAVRHDQKVRRDGALKPKNTNQTLRRDRSQSGNFIKQ